MPHRLPAMAPPAPIRHCLYIACPLFRATQAHRLGHARVGTEDLLWALFQKTDRDSRARHWLGSQGILNFDVAMPQSRNLVVQRNESPLKVGLLRFWRDRERDRTTSHLIGEGNREERVVGVLLKGEGWQTVPVILVGGCFRFPASPYREKRHDATTAQLPCVLSQDRGTKLYFDVDNRKGRRCTPSLPPKNGGERASGGSFCAHGWPAPPPAS